MNTDPSPFITQDSLEEAYRQLTRLVDVHLEEEGEVPAWIVAAECCVRAELESDSNE
jgi:hypothetical protein